MYFQKATGEICDGKWEKEDWENDKSGWTFKDIVKAEDVFADTPLAAVMWEDVHIRLYHVDDKYTVREILFDGRKQKEGSLGGKNLNIVRLF
ncbi:hypothetical protein ABW20_dc0106665 [Dactylellina cionopaga]|nr:hypothetical protein ABW20_dc0106665 [Dactylellina cionopaga]